MGCWGLAALEFRFHGHCADGGVGVWGCLRFRDVSGFLLFRVSGLGFRVQGLVFRV